MREALPPTIWAPGPPELLLRRHVKGGKPAEGTFGFARETLFYNDEGVAGGTWRGRGGDIHG